MAEHEEKGAEFYNFFNQNKRKLDKVGKKEQESEENIELSLGLSLNGRFGNEMPKRKKMGLMGERHVSVLVSHGSGSSGVSECQNLPVCRVANVFAEATSPGSFQSQSPPNQNEYKQTHAVDETELKTSSTESISNITNDMMKNMMMNMPSVSTRDIGPSGKRTAGFLYRYKKGEEVRIVCVCHGSFLTPAEFVKHAGGGDVPHPLKHIVVNPSRLL